MMSATRIIYLLSRRWREENCFKFMIEHFGINLLCTYPDETLSLIRGLWQQPGNIRMAERNVEVELEPLDMQSMRRSLNTVLEKPPILSRRSSPASRSSFLKTGSLIGPPMRLVALVAKLTGIPGSECEESCRASSPFSCR